MEVYLSVELCFSLGCSGVPLGLSFVDALLHASLTGDHHDESMDHHQPSEPFERREHGSLFGFCFWEIVVSEFMIADGGELIEILWEKKIRWLAMACS